MDGTTKLLLTPPKAVEYLANHGVTLSAATLASWRTKDPGRVPYRKVFGRIYYEASVLKAVVNGETAEAV